MKIPKFRDKQMIDLTEQQAIAELLQAGMTELVKNTVFTDDFTLLSGLACSQAAVADGTILVAAGKALHAGHLIAIDAAQTVKVLSGSTGWGTAQAAHATLPRYDIVCIKYATQETDTVSKNFVDDSDPQNPTQYAQSVTTRISDYYELTVVHGTAAASPAVPATPAGYVKLCEILIAAAATTVVNSMITNKLPSAVSTLTKVFNDLKTHSEASVLAHPDNSVTDIKIGNRTTDPAIATAYSNTGTITQLFSWLTKAIKAAVGGAEWYTAPTRTLEAVNTLAENAADTASGAAGAISDHASVGATTSGAGHIQLATEAEVTEGTDAAKAVTPAALLVELLKKASLTGAAFTGQVSLTNTVGALNLWLKNSATQMNQIFFGSSVAVGNIAASIGTQYGGGSLCIAHNAFQPTKGADMWTQNHSSYKSLLLRFTLNDGLYYYEAAAGKAAGDFATFWGAAQGLRVGVVGVAYGGTGQTTLALARNAMGLGNTTGALPVANGGTGAATAAAALTALGLTATAAEINLIDGLTATAAELNILDGVTGVTAAEISYLGDVTSLIQAQLNAKSLKSTGIVYAAASKTFALTDADTLNYFYSASALTATIPLNSAVAFPVGTTIAIGRYGTGALSVVATAGVTIYSSGSKKSIKNQYETACLVKLATDTWWLVGSLTT